MTPINLRKERILDGEQLFKLYYTDMGSARSVGKVLKYLNAKGIINKETGRPVTHMAIWFSMYRWAMNHLDESYRIFNTAMADEGKFHTQAEWEAFVVEKAGIIVKHNERSLNKWQSRTQNAQTMQG